MSTERVIALIDMDCFYVQCEQRLQPDRWGQPCAVAQYNNWKGGILIAVNYEARDGGVKRYMRGSEATAVCPDLHVFAVPEVRGKADLTRYRDASQEVFNAIQESVQSLTAAADIIVEKASVDEAFVDLTAHVNHTLDQLEPPAVPTGAQLPDTYLELAPRDDPTAGGNDLGQWLDELRDDNGFLRSDDIRLALAALVVQRIRAHIADKTQFRCSAGISHNKMLAKLACGLNKPNAQTLLPRAGVGQLFPRIDISKVRSLGGKFGQNLKQAFGANTMYDLKCLEYQQLAAQYDQKTAKWLTDMANGYDDEPVSNRQLSKSIGCGKNFPGKKALTSADDIRHWVRQLCEELVERITRDKEVNKRAPKLMTVSFKMADKDHNSRSLPVDQWLEAGQLAELVMRQVFLKMAKLEPIVNLAIAASKFVDECDEPSHNTHKLDNYFARVTKSHAFECNNEFIAKRFKSLPTNTKTLNDFWSASNVSNDCNDRSVDSDLAASKPSTSSRVDDNNGSDVEIIETNVVPMDVSNNGTNSAANNASNNTINKISIKSLINTSNNASNKASNKSSNKMSNTSDIRNKKTTSDEKVVTIQELFHRKEFVRRGFFFRKMIQLKAEQREREEKERLESRAKKLAQRERRERIEKSGKTKITGYFKPKTGAKS